MEAERGGTSVCVTGASGLIGSWLVMRLLERSYYVRATVRDPANLSKVRHLLDLPKAHTHLSLWKADMTEEGSFDDAIHGCAGVFHVATPTDIFSVKDPENEIIKPTINGVLNIMRSCSKGKTVKRLIYTSTTGTITIQQHPQPEYDESCWTDVEFCKAQKMTGWMYFVAKTMAEKVAWEFAKEIDLDLVTIQPSIVAGPFITLTRSGSIDALLTLITRNEALYQVFAQFGAVHLDDVCNAHIYLFEHPQARGRYICSSHCFTIFELAKWMSQKYPEYDIPTKFKGVDESLNPIPCSSKKLVDLGFKFKYNSDEFHVGDLFCQSIESCKEKGLIPKNIEFRARTGEEVNYKDQKKATLFE